jgi:methyltransferase (TIGR00027 family)
MLTAADTAYSIALLRGMEGDLPAALRLFEDPYGAIFAAAGEHAREGTERFVALPFARDGIRLRTRFIDDAVRDGLAAGVDQVVLLGAGFDARGLRMPEIPARGARVYEVDLPGQLERKGEILRAASVALPPWIVYVSSDFASDFGDTLLASLEARGFRRGAGAIFVWEGVIGYIDADAIDRSLAFMVRAGGKGTRVAVTFVHDDFDGLKLQGRVRKAGFTSFEEHGADAIWRRYMPGAGEPHEHAWAMRFGLAVV